MPHTSDQPLRIDGERLLSNFEGLKAFGGKERGGLDGRACSEADLEARACERELMEDAGLAPRVDAGGRL